VHGDPDESRRPDGDEPDLLKVPEGETRENRTEGEAERGNWGDPELL
jgi:hypothetical protein